MDFILDVARIVLWFYMVNTTKKVVMMYLSNKGYKAPATPAPRKTTRRKKEVA